MTGVQLMTGAPTYQSASPVDLHYVDIDIEKHLIDAYPEIVDRILEIYRDSCQGNLPCIVATKSAGLRLSAFAPYLDKKRAFKDEVGMLLEIFSEKGLSRLDGRYAMLEGSILDIPTIPREALQDIHAVISDVATEKSVPHTERKAVSESQIGNLSIQWDKDGRSQLFSTEHCQATSHKSTRNEVRFTKYADGSIDGKCFNCGETWWEIPPAIDSIIEEAPSPIEIHNRSFRHWTDEERIVVNRDTRCFTRRWMVRRYAGIRHTLRKPTSDYRGNLPSMVQPEAVEKRRVWSTQFGKCEKCGNLTADWVDRYLLTTGRYCNACHADKHLGSYLEWELSRKLPNSIISEHQGYLGDDPEFVDFRLWEPEMLTHLGAGMSTGKSTEIYKAICITHHAESGNRDYCFASHITRPIPRTSTSQTTRKSRMGTLA